MLNLHQICMNEDKIVAQDLYKCAEYLQRQTVAEKLSRRETSSIRHQQFANMLLCRSHTHQF